MFLHLVGESKHCGFKAPSRRRAVGELVEHPMEADSVEACTTFHGSKSNFYGSRRSFMQVDESFHGSFCKFP